MSRQYDNYLREHIDNVYRAYLWFMANIGEEELDDIFPEIKHTDFMIQMKFHDQSKGNIDEYDPYDRYFYGEGKSVAEVREGFNKAFLMHIHRNPHHWQYWVLIHDDKETGDPKMDPVNMPDNYILEMICDWWSFSWKKYNESEDIEDLKEIFDWYDEHKNEIVMSDETRKKVEKILDILEKKLDELEDAEVIDMNDGDETERDIDDPDGGVVVIRGGSDTDS